MHRLKGDSAALGLHKFEFVAHALEDELDTVVKENEKITGKELLPAITKLRDLFGELDNMRSLVGKFASALANNSAGDMTLENAEGMLGASPTQTAAPQATAASKDPLQNLVATVAERTGKRAVLASYGMQDDAIPSGIAESVNSIAVQLIRNSIVHGCLEPEQRVAAGKSDFINITTSFFETDDGYQLIVRDDGEGFDEQKIIEKAINLNLISAEDAENIEPGQATKLAFRSGFSALDEAEMDGGRGVGLDVVHDMVKQLGGNIFVQQKQGRHCQFKITFPKKDAE